MTAEPDNQHDMPPAEDAPLADDTPEPVIPSDPVASLRDRWRDFWQIPTLALAAGVLILGVAIAIGNAPDPQFTPSIDRAERMIDREQYADAIGLLNHKIYPWLEDEGVLSQRDIQRYHLAKARSIYYGQKQLGIDDERNHLSVIREYLDAEREGLDLPPQDLAALTDSYLSRGEIDAALLRLDGLAPWSGPSRDPVVRRAVALLLRPPVSDQERALSLLADVVADPDSSLDQRVWALERQAGVRLEAGYLDETITQLLREMPRIADADQGARARLHLVLARAYRMSGADRQAELQIRFADGFSVPGDTHYPGVVLERARLRQRAGDAAIARDLYSIIVERHVDSEAYPWALIGVGETEAVLGEPTLSLDAFSTLVDNYDVLDIEVEPSRAQLLASLLERAGEALSQGAPSDAVRYGALAERAIGAQDAPPSLLDLMSAAHEAVAEQLAAGATTKRNPLVGLDPSTRAEVQRHLLSAATYRRLYADEFLLTDLRRYADSLWRAGDLFDRSGDQREAIQTFKIYTESLPSDPRHAEARFRMGEALRAMGDFVSASQIYRDLIAEREGTGGVDIGAWADASHVPLAQAFLYDEDPGNDDEAERLLLRAIDGTMAGTRTELFRDALVELAMLYDRTGRPGRAIERLEEVVERYPTDRMIGLLTYRLGEANRRLADDILDSLSDSIPPATREQRIQLVRRHREDAIGRYRDSIRLLAAKRAPDRSSVEELALRNAHFYAGDVLSDLERFDEAIVAYDLSRDRYPGEAATLVAMIQIVNAHMARGDLLRARTANERARRFYLSLPDTAWNDPTLPMDRSDWEAWLRASSELLAVASENGS
ncbi:MAG: tetratricopeptide repeat protein [Planctomycetota bacterium]